MTEQRNEGSPRVERALETLFTTPVPEPAFVSRLEQQLAMRVQAMAQTADRSRARPSWTSWLPSFRRHRWALAVAGLLLLFIVALAAVGPQRVLAGIQDLLGYVPGIGFVDLEATRLLAAPVEVSRDGVTLRVEQVIAGPDRTKVVIHSEGLPPEDHLWPGGAREEEDYQPLLRLPDGDTLATGTWTLRLGGGTLEFPPLPDGVYRVTLELARLPLVPPGAAPENWQVPLDLRPATGDLVAELFPEPYTPAGAEDTHQGITLRVLAVAHSPEETVVRMQMEWSDPDWDYPTIGFDLPQLRDDLGHAYHQAMASSSGSSVQTEVIRVPEGQGIPPTPEVPTYEQTEAFAPVSPSARQLALWVDAVQLEVPVEAAFVVDLGDDPQVGDSWPLDVHLTVAGFAVQLTGARLVQEEMQLRDGPMQRTLLLFAVEPVPDQNGQTLHSVQLQGDMEMFEGGYGGYRPQSRTIETGLQLRTGAATPTGPVEVRVEGAGVVFHGPWTMTWSVPGADGTDEVQGMPVILHPAQARETRAGLTLQAGQVVRTDRVTAVTVELVDPPPDVTLSRVLAGDQVTGKRGLYLEDERGRRYDLSNGISWGAGPGQTSEVLDTSEVSQTLNFEPLNPLARRATLHVPALEMFVAGRIAFDVMVPEGVEMQARDEPPWPASEPWAIDVLLEAGGYHLRLAQARLDAIDNTTSLVLIPEGPTSRPAGPWLTGLRPTSIVAPDGRPLDLVYASRFDRTGTTFDLADPNTGAVLPGRYHFEVEGVTVAVPGPWDLTWDLRQP